MQRVIRDLSLIVAIMLFVMVLNSLLGCLPADGVMGTTYLTDQPTPNQETINVSEVNQGDETTIIVACGHQVIRYPHRCHKH